MPSDLSTMSPTVEPAFLSAIIETQNDVAAVELDPVLVMQIIVERTQKLTGADGALIELIEGNQTVCQAVSGIAAPCLGLRSELESSTSGRAVQSRLIQHCNDTELDPGVDKARCRRAGVRSLMSMPLYHIGQAVGVLKVLSRTPGGFTSSQCASLQLMGGLLAASLSHAAEFEIKKRLLAERTDAYAALQESEERFRSAFDHAAIGMALVALNGRWMQVNRSICRIVGYAASELLVTDFQSITYPPDLDADLAHVRQLIAGETDDYQMVKRYVHRQGHLVWVLLSVSLVRDRHGKPLYFISQIQDITQRHQAEELLRASEEEFRATFELAGVGKVQLDLATSRFLRVNDKMCQMTGYTADELKCLTVAELSHPDDISASRDSVVQLIRGEIDNWNAEKRYICKNGQTLWVSVHASVIRDAAGKPIRAVATILDITARKHAEWLEQDRRRVLEMVARDLPLPDVMGQLGEAIERQIAGAKVGVAVLNDGEVFLHGPGLPPQWRDAIQGRCLRIVSQLSSSGWSADSLCGVTYMQYDEVWSDLRAQAESHGLRRQLDRPGAVNRWHVAWLASDLPFIGARPIDFGNADARYVGETGHDLHRASQHHPPVIAPGPPRSADEPAEPDHVRGSRAARVGFGPPRGERAWPSWCSTSTNSRPSMTPSATRRAITFCNNLPSGFAGCCANPTRWPAWAAMNS